MSQIHSRFTDSQIKEMFEKYLNHGIERKLVQQILGIKKTRFFHLIKRYKENPQKFSIQYFRDSINRKISHSIETSIIKELEFDKALIQNQETAIRSYNYSYIKDTLKNKHKQIVSLPTIIDRAKKYGFYFKKAKKKHHDREVLTAYPGQLIQHDSSHHKWSPYAQEKWYLITSLDDFSRFILYAALVMKETTWTHIYALESLILKYGIPFEYYVDSHSIFRFVRGRDELHYKHHLQTDETDPQWKQVLRELNVNVIHALSPQAKGKIERPYGWIQDRLVRTCARENISDIKDARPVLSELIKQYNYHWIHSTTGEIPFIRFQRAIAANHSLFREFKVPAPFLSTKDIFSLRLDRITDAYRKISINNLKLDVNHADPFKNMNIRIYPLNNLVSELRFWCSDKLLDIQKIKNSDLQGVHF
jgi:hypothetical protein